MCFIRLCLIFACLSKVHLADPVWFTNRLAVSFYFFSSSSSVKPVLCPLWPKKHVLFSGWSVTGSQPAVWVPRKAAELMFHMVREREREMGGDRELWKIWVCWCTVRDMQWDQQTSENKDAFVESEVDLKHEISHFPSKEVGEWWYTYNPHL